MRRVEVAELVLLAAVFAVGLVLAAALILQHYCRRGSWGSTNKPCSSELPLSRSRPGPATTKQSRLLMMLCSGRRHRARVEPASTSSAEAATEVEDVARWRERWFGGPASRALYTIEEEEDKERPSEPETPFYTPPASPHSPPAA